MTSMGKNVFAHAFQNFVHRIVIPTTIQRRISGNTDCYSHDLEIH